MPAPLWSPSAERIAASRMEAFRRFVNQRHALGLADYPALHAWSVQRREAFWQAIVDFFEVRFQQPPRAVLEEGTQMPSARWFPGATLNFAEHLLRRRDDAPALIAVSEDGRREVLSHAELARHVAGLQKRLAALGIGPGDRVAALMPNTWQTVVGMLATASLGATWSSCSPDFGTQGVIDRFGQIEPRVLIACAGYRYAGKSLDLTAKLNEVLAGLPGLEQLLVVPYDRPQAQPQDYRCQARVALWDGFYQAEGEPVFTPVPFEQPLYILYSSGTTGVPKCIVHATGGVLLQHLKEHGLHTDLGDGDRLFYYTTCGWMMWNWLASGLAVGASLVLYDGSPFHPGPERLLDLVDAEDIAVFGASAKYLAALEKAGVRPRHSHRLDSLRTLLSTGSPLAHESFDYVYRELKSDLCLSSISGGTDIVPASPSATRCCRCGAANCNARRWAWPWKSGTTTAAASPAARASWSAPGISRRSRWASGTTRMAPGSTTPTSPVFPASGPMATTPRKPPTAGWSSTAAPTRCSIPAACASAPRKSTARWKRSRKSSSPSPSARTGRAMCVCCCSSACATACDSTSRCVNASARPSAPTPRRATYRRRSSRSPISRAP